MLRRLVSLSLTALAIAAVAWSATTYDAALRDPRFLDGWVLAAAMAGQLFLHLGRRRILPLPGGDSAWVVFHIYAGLFAAAVFALHTGGSPPDTAFEWALWALFVVVAITGGVGLYLTRTIPQRLDDHGPRVRLETISALRSELAHRAALLALQSTDGGNAPVVTFYREKLHGFFKRPRHLWAHLTGSGRPLQRLLFDFDALEAELDDPARARLQALKELAGSKNRLDLHYANEGAIKAWLFVHVPATYGLVVLSLFHIVTIYAYRSGVA